jgi:GH25 family lysozyme M1 (1,4-beta-N-acetylmuramidase)
VHRKLKVRAIIYVSPSFWTTNLKDTTWFAEHGYPLWIAHWGTDTPSIPAEEWAGENWTFWQWTSCGSVKGINGNVDMDLFRGDKLKRVIIENAKT